MISRFFKRKRKSQILYHHTDEQFGTVSVEESNRIRYLKFGNHIKQGAMNLGDPDRVHLLYQRTMLEVFETKSYASCLCLGLGAGSMPRYIQQNRLCQRIEVVEVNPVVIDVARAWFDLPDEVQLHNRDAMDFVVGSSRQYDLILVDLFDMAGTPLEFKMLSFYRKLFGLLREGGAVVVNLWASDFGDLLLEEKLRSVFDAVEVKRAKRNHITICRREGDV